jgi:hypothetical protein
MTHAPSRPQHRRHPSCPYQVYYACAEEAAEAADLLGSVAKHCERCGGFSHGAAPREASSRCRQPLAGGVMKLSVRVEHDRGAVTIHADHIGSAITPDRLAAILAAELLAARRAATQGPEVEIAELNPAASAPAIAAPGCARTGVLRPAAAPAPDPEDDREEWLRHEVESLFTKGLDDQAVCERLGISKGHLLRLDDPAIAGGAAKTVAGAIP